jgi:hypothetical protein
MKMLRTLFVASSVLALSAATLSAQDAQVTCKDGAKSKAGRGACSGHGGVAAAAKTDAKIEKTAATAEKKIDKTAATADKKIEKTADKAEAKTEKTAETKVAKKHHTKTKAKA